METNNYFQNKNGRFNLYCKKKYQDAYNKLFEISKEQDQSMSVLVSRAVDHYVREVLGKNVDDVSPATSIEVEPEEVEDQSIF